MEKLLRPTSTGGFNYWCVGCKTAHYLKPGVWIIKNAEEAPTITPSILLNIPDHIIQPFEKALHSHPDSPVECHSYITDGKINYLNDCTHELKGQTVDMVKF